MAQVMKVVAPTWYVQLAPLVADDSSFARVREEAKVASQERLKRELAAFLQEVARLQPLVLFLDDLHWADASTVDLLAYVGSKCAAMRLLLVLSYRPSDLLLSQHPFLHVKLELQGRGVCREILLAFLSPLRSRTLSGAGVSRAWLSGGIRRSHPRAHGRQSAVHGGPAALLARARRDRPGARPLDADAIGRRHPAGAAGVGAQHDPAEDRSAQRSRPPLAGGGQRAGIRVRRRGGGQGAGAGGRARSRNGWRSWSGCTPSCGASRSGSFRMRP